jgi:trehalose/maltose hydrolase-like predicted phosphorylase
VAARLGKVDQAWDLFTRSRDLDLDVAHGKAAEGIHIACAANNWSAVVLGFLGLATAMETETLTLNPRLPAHWAGVACPLVWRGAAVTVETDGRRTTITNHSGSPLDANVHAETASVPAGASHTFGAQA